MLNSLRQRLLLRQASREQHQSHLLLKTDSQNRLVVAASSAGTDSTYSILVGRFLPDNSLDTTFGVGGYAELKSIPGISEGFGVQIDEINKRILVSASQSNTANGGGSGIIVALDLTGKIDATWGSKGIVSLPESWNHSAFDLDSEGRIYTFPKTGHVSRYTTAGILDTTFGTDGSYAFDSLTFTNGIDLKVSQDKLYILAATGHWKDSDLFIVDIKAKTSKRTTFGKITDGGSIYPESIDADHGRVMIVGRRIDAAHKDGYFIAAFNADGAVDANFGAGGMIETQEGSLASSVIIESPTSYLVSGYFGVRRYDATGGIVKDIMGKTYFSADSISIGTDGSLAGASVAHGGADIFRIKPGY